MAGQTQRMGQRRQRQYGAGLLVAGVIACTACGATDEGELPPNVPDPATVQTSSGAVAFYRGVLTMLPGNFEPLLHASLITDEMTASPVPSFQSGAGTGFDSRDRRALEATGSGLYGRQHRLRAQARMARAFLVAYAPDSPGALRGHLYALEGYAEIFLADNFCSGIPLSTVDFGADYTLAAGSSTTEVYRHALAFFDSALTLVDDSLQFRHLAAVGRGRALLALGRYADAAASVATVPDGFKYQVTPLLPASNRWSNTFTGTMNLRTGQMTVGDLEGSNGLNYRSSGDPRTAVVSRGFDLYGNEIFAPVKYFPSSGGAGGAYLYTYADGIEARLIEAEAALQAGSGEWLTKLNALRTDGTFDTQPTADPNDDPANTDTLWNAGSGGVAGLRPLDDPETDASRVDLLFRERAFWLYLTGHRQGDLRRLVRQYGRSPETVYPTGFYPGGNGVYGNDVVIPVPDQERELNPMYTGCINFDS